MAPPYWVHTAIGAASTAIRGLHIWSMHTNSSKKHWLRVLSLSIILLGQVAMCILYRYRFDIAIVIAIILSMGFYVLDAFVTHWPDPAVIKPSDSLLFLILYWFYSLQTLWRSTFVWLCIGAFVVPSLFLVFSLVHAEVAGILALVAASLYPLTVLAGWMILLYRMEDKGTDNVRGYGFLTLVALALVLLVRNWDEALLPDLNFLFQLHDTPYILQRAPDLFAEYMSRLLTLMNGVFAVARWFAPMNRGDSQLELRRTSAVTAPEPSSRPNSAGAEQQARELV